MAIRIPKSQEEAFGTFLTMEPKARAAFLEQVRRTPVSLPLDELASGVAASLGRDKQEVSGILGVLISLYQTYRAMEVPSDEFIASVSNAGEALMQRLSDKRNVDWTSVKQHLSEAIDIDQPLGIVAKALDLMFEYEKVFYEARVLTDVRAVFQEDPTAKPVGVMIVHNLRVCYYEDGNERTTYFALDTEDIRKLQRELDRALAKESTLQAVMAGAGLRCLVKEARPQ